jgi:hypothetical protein
MNGFWPVWAVALKDGVRGTDSDLSVNVLHHINTFTYLKEKTSAKCATAMKALTRENLFESDLLKSESTITKETHFLLIISL